MRLPPQPPAPSPQLLSRPASGRGARQPNGVSSRSQPTVKRLTISKANHSCPPLTSFRPPPGPGSSVKYESFGIYEDRLYISPDVNKALFTPLGPPTFAPFTVHFIHFSPPHPSYLPRPLHRSGTCPANATRPQQH